MSRNAIVVVAGLVVVGTVVAMLPAQESSRRTASKYYRGPDPVPQPAQPEPQPAAIQQGNLAPILTPSSVLAPGTSAPAEATPANLQEQLQAAGQQISREYTPPPTMPQPIAPANEAPSAFQPPQTLPTAYQPGAAPAPIPSEPLPPTTTPPTTTPPTTMPPTTTPPASGAFALPPAAETPAAEQPSLADDSQLRSVLKRGRPAANEPAPPPTQPFLPMPAAPPAAPPIKATAPGGSSRRAPAPTAPSRGPASASAQTGRSIQELAIVGRSAALRVEVAGPQGITVGKPATYVVNVVNESDTTAEDVMLRLALPGWVSVKGGQPSHGELEMQPDGQGAGRLVWNLPLVAARGHEQLRLSLVTAEGDAFDLNVEWASKPVAMRAAIVVKQPQLELSLAGPADMTFGEEKTFTLTVSNPGTGDAERVVVNVASGNSPAQQIDAGSIPAGTKKELPLAVVASQAGEMELRASAAAEGGLEARTTGKIVVRKAEVSVAVQGPPLKFAGTEAIYVVTVSNTGSAPADNVNLSLALPANAKYLGGIDGAAAAGGGLKWKIGTLAANTERTYEVRTQLAAAGLNRLVVQAQSAGGNVSAEAETEVEAVSDLKLVVNDPSGPLPVGEQAVYEVQVMNRGSQAAQKVKIIMQFSDGIEPVSFEGCDARLVPGQVLCQPLPQLGAGEQVTLRVRAKGQKAGTHQFRIEVTSTDGDTRLVSEGTTRYFSETGRTGSAATTARQPTPAGPIQR